MSERLRPQQAKPRFVSEFGTLSTVALNPHLLNDVDRRLKRWALNSAQFHSGEWDADTLAE
jgi:hypothetical protein